MSIALMVTDRDLTQLVSGLSKLLPDEKIIVWPDVCYDETIEFVVAWHHPTEMWELFPNLKAISSLGAGVDQLIADLNCPEYVAITRVVDADLSEQMATYCLTVLLMYQANLPQYIRNQPAKLWQVLPKSMSRKVTILGAGEIGLSVARKLAKNGFEVCTWSQTKKIDDAISHSFVGKEQLIESIGNADFVISVLPSTKETEHLIDKALLESMDKDAVLINVGRGDVINETQLVQALNDKEIAGAVLDVFSVEPLPMSSPLWEMPNVTITPHVAAVTSQIEVVKQIAENYQRLKQGKALKHQVDVKKGY